tara:strand:+ start:1805 stop:2344 length:540 start_codon:yes stop_codon:yes gene_type:complete
MSELRTNRIVPRDGLPAGSAGGIIQVKSTTMTTTATYSISGMTWTEVGGLTTTITPTRSDSKILIMLTMGGMSSNGEGQRWAVALRRDNSNITGAINSDGTGHTRASWSHTGRALGNAIESHPAFNHLDSPATTSAVSYKVMITTEGSYTLYVNRSHSDSSSSSVFRTASSLTLMEISG